MWSQQAHQYIDNLAEYRMGSGVSRNDRKNAFGEFTLYMATLIEQTSWFLLSSPKTVSEKKRKLITLKVDVFMAMIANAALRLKKLDSTFEDNIDIVTMFDAILHVLWISIAKRYPHISRDNNQIKKPKFIDQSEYIETCQWYQQKIVNMVTTLCQSFVIIGNCVTDEISDMRDPNPHSILSILEVELETTESHLHTIAHQNSSTDFERQFYGNFMLDFLRVLHDLKERLLTYDIETLKTTKRESMISSSSSSSGSDQITIRPSSKRDSFSVVKRIHKQSSEQPLRNKLMKQEYEKNARNHQRSASEGQLPTIDESPRKEAENNQSMASQATVTKTPSAPVSVRGRSVSTSTPPLTNKKQTPTKSKPTSSAPDPVPPQEATPPPTQDDPTHNAWLILTPF